MPDSSLAEVVLGLVLNSMAAPTGQATSPHSENHGR
jgi:hypothetical protein